MTLNAEDAKAIRLASAEPDVARRIRDEHLRTGGSKGD